MTRVLSILLVCTVCGCNPFAPRLERGDIGNLYGDPTTVDGFFTAFKTAYELRDVSLYEPLIDSSFTFEYYDYDAQVERIWGFSRELESTRRMFESAESIRLQWNQMLVQDTLATSGYIRVVRSFNLTISLSADGFRGDGNVNFLLRREDDGAPWKLFRWRDESEF